MEGQKEPQELGIKATGKYQLEITLEKIFLTLNYC